MSQSGGESMQDVGLVRGSERGVLEHGHMEPHHGRVLAKVSLVLAKVSLVLLYSWALCHLSLLMMHIISLLCLHWSAMQVSGRVGRHRRLWWRIKHQDQPKGEYAAHALQPVNDRSGSALDGAL